MIRFSSPFPKNKQSLRKVLSLRLIMKSLLIALAILGVIFILLTISIMGWIGADIKMSSSMPMPRNMILTIDFDKPISEKVENDFLSPFPQEQQISFYDLIKYINVAATDDKVKALAAEINISSLGAAQIQELRSTIAYFRSKGKKTYIYSSGMGNLGGGTSEYYLATAFDEIWMQPNTEIGITGINIEVPFLRKILDKLGIKPEFYARYEYKNAMSSLLDKKLSPQYKSEINKLGGTLYFQMIHDMAAARNINKNTMLKLVNNAPIIAENGIEEKLIDKIGFKTDFINDVKLQNDKASLYPMVEYVANTKDLRGKLPLVAILALEGEIAENDEGVGAFQGNVISSKHTLTQLEEISKLPNLRGLVLRINSPGGSYTSSAEIWNAIIALKKVKNIPVVVSMGNYAASGGYFIALAGDYIFAEPLTITGSIGVLGGKMVLAELWNKLGVNWEGIKFGENAGILSSNRNFSKSEKLVFNRSLDNVYKDFANKVMQARNISSKEIDNVARGRIWLGVDAVKHNLVDELGGIGESLLKIRELLGDEKQKYRVVFYPKVMTFPEKIAQLMYATPKITTKELVQSLGISLNELKMLNHLQYDTIMLPMNIDM